jgi:hypothetical protein
LLYIITGKPIDGALPTVYIAPARLSTHNIRYRRMRLCAGNRYIIRGVFSVLFPPDAQTQTLFLHTYIQPAEAMSVWIDRETRTGGSVHDGVTATCDPISDIVRLHEYWSIKAMDDRTEAEMHRLVLTGMMTCSGRYARQWCNDQTTAYPQLNRLSVIEQVLRRRGQRVRPVDGHRCGTVSVRRHNHPMSEQLRPRVG